MNGLAYFLGLILTAFVPLTVSSAIAGVDEGKIQFEQKCISCHSIGGGRKVGPDLKGITTRREMNWLVKWITGPDKMIAAKDPTAMQLLQEYNNIPMPAQGVGEQDAKSILAYVASESAAGASKQTTALTTGPSGDVIRGKNLFTGATRFKNGGPACMACHSVSGIGALGGGALGPDLTQTYQKFGEEGFASVLGNIPFPTMQPIFKERPLTPEEQADIIAFLRQVIAERPHEALRQLAFLSAVVAIGLLILANFLWRKRSQGVRRQLVTRGGV